MAGIRVSMTELRRRLGELVNRAAYGGERIVLVSRGAPKAAIVGIEQLQGQLRDQPSAGGRAEDDGYSQALAAADELRERIRRWQEAHGVEPEDAVTTLDRLRQERDGELTGLC